MTLRPAYLVAVPLALALAGCGRSNDAATPAEADTVEIPANEALQPVTEAPVADPNANAPVNSGSAAAPAPGAATAIGASTAPGTATPAMTEEDRIKSAGDSAADTAAQAADAMNETAATAAEEAQQ